MPYGDRHYANPMITLLFSGDLMVKKNSPGRPILGILGSNLESEVGEDSKEALK